MSNSSKALKLYSWPTPNSFKVSIALREMGLEYDFFMVNISEGEQFSPEFLKLNPNNKIPVLVDANGPEGEEFHIFESGAILEYLADKTGMFLDQKKSSQRYKTLQWVYWQMAGLGPMLGQNHHFSQYAPEKIPYAIDRYISETTRLYKLLDWQLRSNTYVAGDELSIADFACYPWIVSHEKQSMKLEDFPSLQKWFVELGKREHFIAAYREGDELKAGRNTVTEESRKFLFGQKGDHLK
ncbi:thiol:disulfide oxidoreductase [bacterium]|nr:thiol:disulfide oxidoreductase [bacterium]